MPAEAGIHLRFRGGFSQQFDLRQNIRLDRDRRFSHRPRLLDLRNFSPLRHPRILPRMKIQVHKPQEIAQLQLQKLGIEIAKVSHQEWENTKEEQVEM